MFVPNALFFNIATYNVCCAMSCFCNPFILPMNAKKSHLILSLKREIETRKQVSTCAVYFKGHLVFWLKVEQKQVLTFIVAITLSLASLALVTDVIV